MSTTPKRPPLSLDLLSRLSRTHHKQAHGTAGAAHGTPPGDLRLDIPPSLGTSLGCDAVGVPARLAPRLMKRLPQVGCVFADPTHWWWIVPGGSDIETDWPAPTRYASDVRVPAAAPGAVSAQRPPALRLVHRPAGRTASAYTPPLPLYFVVCQLAGTTPSWSAR
ncbi:hypothetical protein [Streptomyces sp. NPDC060194]|uniref:hypothetical protein n=1 Tax=Streptomyces sp. NPDC060194 TaxID=3347069 RepID=UPI00365154DD